jgi:hypothetical protein
VSAVLLGLVLALALLELFMYQAELIAPTRSPLPGSSRAATATVLDIAGLGRAHLRSVCPMWSRLYGILLVVALGCARRVMLMYLAVVEGVTVHVLALALLLMLCVSAKKNPVVVVTVILAHIASAPAILWWMLAESGVAGILALIHILTLAPVFAPARLLALFKLEKVLHAPVEGLTRARRPVLFKLALRRGRAEAIHALLLASSKLGKVPRAPGTVPTRAPPTRIIQVGEGSTPRSRSRTPTHIFQVEGSGTRSRRSRSHSPPRIIEVGGTPSRSRRGGSRSPTRIATSGVHHRVRVAAAHDLARRPVSSRLEVRHHGPGMVDPVHLPALFVSKALARTTGRATAGLIRVRLLGLSRSKEVPLVADTTRVLARACAPGPLPSLKLLQARSAEGQADVQDIGAHVRTPAPV